MIHTLSLKYFTYIVSGIDIDSTAYISKLLLFEDLFIRF